MIRSAPYPRPAAGFTLVEILVALVVLSVGLLGIAGLFVESLQSGRTASQRVQAIALATDMAERIRANRDGLLTYDDGASGAGAIDARCEEGGGGCDSVAMAGHDKAEWLDALATSLPSGTGTVVVDPGTVPATITITVGWVEPSLGDAAAQSYVLGFQT